MFILEQHKNCAAFQVFYRLSHKSDTITIKQYQMLSDTQPRFDLLSEYNTLNPGDRKPHGREEVVSQSH